MINLHELSDLKEIRVSEKIKLRPIKSSDARRILQILDSDPSIRETVTVASKLFSAKDVEAEVESLKNNDHLMRYAVVGADNLIGLLTFWRDVDRPFEGPDHTDGYGFGFFLDPKERGKGIMTMAVRAVMVVAKKCLQPNQFVAYCEDGNVSSIAVLNRLGFKPTDITLTEQNTGWLERKYVASVD